MVCDLVGFRLVAVRSRTPTLSPPCLDIGQASIGPRHSAHDCFVRAYRICQRGYVFFKPLRRDWAYQLIDEGKILVAMDRDTEELLLVESLEGMEDDLDLRMSLIKSWVVQSLVE